MKEKELSNLLTNLFENQKYEDALKLALETINKTPNYSLAWKIIGLVFYIYKDYLNALKNFHKALELNQNDYSLYTNIATTYTKLGDIKNAKNYYHKAIKIDPNSFDNYFNLANLLYNNKELQDAEVFYIKALKIDPNNPEIYYYLANVLQETHRDNDAKELYKKAISLNPSFIEAYYNLALLLQNNKKEKDALNYYNQALKLNPNLVIIYNNLGAVYKSLKMIDKAKKSYLKALELNPNFIEASFNLATLLHHNNEYQDAKTYYHKTLELNPKHTHAYFNLANLFKDTHKKEKAIKYYQKVIEIDKTFVDAYNNIAILLQQNNKFEEAEQYYKKSLSFQPNSFKVWKNLTILVLEQNNIEIYTVFIKNMLQNFPELIYPKYALSQILASEHKHFENIQYIEENCLEEIEKNKEVKYEILTSLAISYWITQKFTSIDSYIENVINTYNKETTHITNTLRYTYYMKLLSNFYKQNIFTTNNADKVFMIGDSHSLSGSGQNIIINEKNYLISTKLIKGCKAFHLSNTKSNKFIYSIKKALEDIPVNSYIILTIGEIDCRTNEGFMLAQEKGYIENIEENIHKTVNDYTDFIKEIAKEKKLNIIYQGIPAPNLEWNNISKETKEKLVYTITKFNSSLKQKAFIDESMFIDTYNLTKGTNGISNKKWHLDNYHLKPSYLKEVKIKSN